MSKIKADRMKELEKLGFKENIYPKNYYVLNEDIAIEPNRNIVVLSKQGEQILKYMEKLNMFEKEVDYE